ncbi:MAG: sigma 54-interacting transcriptional regulator [Gammaproteobacteria bacterium]
MRSWRNCGVCADNPRQQRRLDALEPLIAKKLNELKQTIVLRSQQGFEAAWRVIQTDRGQQLMDDIRGWLEAMEAEEKELLYGRERSAESSTRRAIASITFLTLLNFAFVIAVVVAIHRDLERREQAAVAIRKAYGVLEERVRERTAELARANQDLQSKIGEAQQAEQRLKESRDHMLSVLDRLRLGTVKTDHAGVIIFLSRAAKRLLGKASEEALGTHWEKALPLRVEDRAQLKGELMKPSALRSKLSVQMELPEGRQYWMEIDVEDGTPESTGKIFFLYDVSEIYDLRRFLDERAELQDLVGTSKAMRQVYRRIQQIARVDSIVLIEGETGTGKELVARAIHFSSDRRHKPLIVVNCAGLTESLVASQLFGHKRGAFTGAVADQRGLFEEADGGTLFLDEIGDIPPGVQTSLLRVLQEKEITRLGEARPRRVDARVITATHHDLKQDVAKGSFRADLLYRIRVARIHLPPLRERQEDIPLLVAWFLKQQRARTTGQAVPRISQDAMKVLMGYAWPGNVRELRSAIEFALIRSDGVIRAEDLPPELIGPGRGGAALAELPADQQQQVLAALERAGDNRTLAARLLGISRATLYRRLAQLHRDARG